MFVAGESGIGKSRLVDHFAERAKAGGTRVLWGDCIDLGDSELPYAPLVSALRSLVRAGHPVFDALGPQRAELARLLPELGTPGDLIVEPYAGSAQGRLFELLLMLFEKLSEESPVLLVIDDLHWADRSTRDFLAFLARNVCTPAVVGGVDVPRRRAAPPPPAAPVPGRDRADRARVARAGRALHARGDRRAGRGDPRRPARRRPARPRLGAVGGQPAVRRGDPGRRARGRRHAAGVAARRADAARRGARRDDAGGAALGLGRAAHRT